MKIVITLMKLNIALFNVYKRAADGDGLEMGDFMGDWVGNGNELLVL